VSLSGPLLGRLAGLALVLVIVQLTAASQITVLGATADLAPLVVMAVGLLAGSVPGAVMGFAVGLLVDLALLQTLGVSSLILVGVGYGAGRLRELRDPSHGLIPLAAGAAASGAALIGFSLVQFMLGVDAPVSALLLRQIVAGILLGALLSLPVYALVRRVLEPYLPAVLRRRRHRAYTTGGLSPLSRA